MSDNNIRKNLNSYYDSIDMPGGWSFNMPETLKKINLMANSKYEKGAFDAQGYYKFFYNISKVPVDVARKFIDLDTKDVILQPEGFENELKVFIMQRRFRQWMKDNGFAETLNEIRDDYPKYGSVVVRKNSEGKWESVPLENLRFDPATKRLQDSWVYELVLMDSGEIKSKDWDEDAKERLLSMTPDYGDKYIVYICHEKKDGKWTKTIKGDLFRYKNNRRSTEAMFNDNTSYLPAVTLHEEEDVEFPYREIHWERVRGRWLGLGIIEILVDAQIAVNEAENLERKGLIFKSLQLYQTRDESVGGSNVLTDAENGDVLRVEQEITPLVKDNSDLSAYNNTRNRWEDHAKDLSFSNDISTGQLPSRTAVGTANIQIGQVASYFDELKRENFGIFIKKLVLNDIIPDFKKDTREEFVMTFAGNDEEVEQFTRAVTQIMVDAEVARVAKETGFFPSQAKREELKGKITEQIEKDPNRYAKVPKGFYDNAKYILDIITTGESVDVGARGQIIQFGLQIIGTNPGILQNKTARRMFFKLLALGGVSPHELGIDEQEIDQTPVQPGGSVQAPDAMAQIMESVQQV